MQALHFYCTYWKFYNICTKVPFHGNDPNYEVIDEKQSVKDKELIFDRMERGGGMTVPHLVIFGSKYARV